MNRNQKLLVALGAIAVLGVADNAEGVGRAKRLSGKSVNSTPQSPTPAPERRRAAQPAHRQAAASPVVEEVAPAPEPAPVQPQAQAEEPQTDTVDVRPTVLTKEDVARALGGHDDLTSVRIPDGVAEIKEEAFAECANLAKIILPSTIENIGEKAFQGCTALRSIKIPQNVKTIKKETFRNCSSLRSIDFPLGLTSIGKNSLKDCADLARITFEGAHNSGKFGELINEKVGLSKTKIEAIRTTQVQIED